MLLIEAYILKFEMRQKSKVHNLHRSLNLPFSGVICQTKHYPCNFAYSYSVLKLVPVVILFRSKYLASITFRTTLSRPSYLHDQMTITITYLELMIYTGKIRDPKTFIDRNQFEVFHQQISRPQSTLVSLAYQI